MRNYIVYILLCWYNFSFSQTWEWAKNYGYQYSDYGQSIAVDKDNNIFVKGNSQNTDLLYKFYSNGQKLWVEALPSFGGVVRTDSIGNCFVFNKNMAPGGKIAKYDNSGSVLWLKEIPGVTISDLYTLPSGELIVSGYNISGLNVTVGNSIVSPNYGFVAKTDNDLNFIWVKVQYRYGIVSIAVGPSGKIYTAGNSNGVTQDSSSVRVFDSLGNYFGGIISVNRYLELIAVDKSENIYLAGQQLRTYPLAIDQYTLQINCTDCDPGYIVKFNSNGEKLWHKIIMQHMTLKSLKLDKTANVYIAGGISRGLKIDSFFLDNHISESYVAKFDSNGSLLWAKNSERLLNPSGDNSYSGISDMDLDSEGNPIITGAMGWHHKFDNIVLVSNGLSDFLLAKISQDPVVGTSEMAAPNSNNLIIFPNPNTGKFSISLAGNSLNSISIKNALWQSVFFKNYKNKSSQIETFDLSHLSKGIYFIEVNTDHSAEVKKVIIE
ncbi:MAG: T9SS type A sorting domain-containing protein [Bacteroidota bacterium]